MKVCLVAEQLRNRVPGGIGTYLRGLARGLAAVGGEGPEVILWASAPPRSAPDPVAALGPCITSVLGHRSLMWSWDRGLGGGAPDGDIVHAPSLAVPPAGAAPMAVTVHDLAWRQVPDAFPGRGRRWHEAALGRALSRAKCFIVPSTDTADALMAAGAAAARVEVIEEGCDHLAAQDREAADRLKAELGVEGGFLLTVSTFEPRKNLARLVAAYSAAAPRFPERWPLLVVGPSGWGSGTGRAGDAKENHEGVVMVGPVDDGVLAALYAEARAVVYVPLVEGFGLPAVEAMAAGAPVVASPVPSTAGAALEVDPLDVGAMAEALVRVVADDEVRGRLIAAGRQRAATLTWSATARGHVEVWSQLLGR